MNKCKYTHKKRRGDFFFFFLKFPNVYFESITGIPTHYFCNNIICRHTAHPAKLKATNKQIINKRAMKKSYQQTYHRIGHFNKETIEHRQTHVVTRQQRRRERLRQRRRRPGRRRRHQTAGEAPSPCSFPRRSSWRLAKTDRDGATPPPPNRGAAARLPLNRHLQISRSGGRDRAGVGSSDVRGVGVVFRRLSLPPVGSTSC